MRFAAGATDRESDAGSGSRENTAAVTAPILPFARGDHRGVTRGTKSVRERGIAGAVFALPRLRFLRYACRLARESRL